MELEKKTIFWNRCRKSARPVGIFLALFLLWSGVLFPLGRKIQEGCRQQQQIQQQLQILAAFARQWDPQEAQEAARQLAGNGKELEAPQSREHWLEEPWPVQLTAVRSGVCACFLWTKTERQEKLVQKLS